MNGFWIYGVYSQGQKKEDMRIIKYFKYHSKAEAYAILCDRELRLCGRYAGVKAIWVEE